MSAALSLLPAARRNDVVGRRGVTPLDVVHDHVVHLLRDHETARSVLVDVVVRATARRDDLGTSPTLEDLLRQAHARLASVSTTGGSDELVGDRDDPVTRAVVDAMAAPNRLGAAVLHLTARHGIDLRTAADVVGLERTQAARIRTEALHQVRVALAEAGAAAVDVESALAALPLLPAPMELHDQLGAAPVRRTVPRSLEWLLPVAAVVGLAGAIFVGVPKVVAEDTGDVPMAAATTVDDGPAVRQLRAPSTGLPTEEVEQLVVRPTTPSAATTAPTDDGGSDEPASTQPATEPTPTPEPTPPPSPDEPNDEQSPEPTPEPEPSEGPLDQLLPTGP